MSTNSQLFRLTAFSEQAEGGNPAGVWIGDELPDAADMQAIAADVGYSETAFVAPGQGFERQIRYYSPLAEVPFCGHATIATGVMLGRQQGAGVYRLQSRAGEIRLRVDARDGRYIATLTSVAPRHKAADADLVDATLALLGWKHSELDASLPAAVAYAGAWHLVLAAASRERLDHLDYDFDRLQLLMQDHDLTTLQLVWRENDALLHSRNPFPVGGVVEDAATGAAAAALGGYLRDAGLRTAPFSFDIRQGEVMGRPSLLHVAVPTEGGVDVSGTATDL